MHMATCYFALGKTRFTIQKCRITHCVASTCIRSIHFLDYFPGLLFICIQCIWNMLLLIFQFSFGDKDEHYLLDLDMSILGREETGMYRKCSLGPRHVAP